MTQKYQYECTTCEWNDSKYQFECSKWDWNENINLNAQNMNGVTQSINLNALHVNGMTQFCKMTRMVIRWASTASNILNFHLSWKLNWFIHSKPFVLSIQCSRFWRHIRRITRVDFQTFMVIFMKGKDEGDRAEPSSSKRRDNFQFKVEQRNNWP